MISNDPISQLERDALTALAAVQDIPALEALRVDFLGRKGHLTQVLRGLSSIADLEERRRVGGEANAVKERLEAAFEEGRAAFQQSRLSRVIEGERLDVTLPGTP